MPKSDQTASVYVHDDVVFRSRFAKNGLIKPAHSRTIIEVVGVQRCPVKYKRQRHAAAGGAAQIAKAIWDKGWPCVLLGHHSSRCNRHIGFHGSLLSLMWLTKHSIPCKQGFVEAVVALWSCLTDCYRLHRVILGARFLDFTALRLEWQDGLNSNCGCSCYEQHCCILVAPEHGFDSRGLDGFGQKRTRIPIPFQSDSHTV